MVTYHYIAHCFFRGATATSAKQPLDAVFVVQWPIHIFAGHSFAQERPFLRACTA